MSDNSKPTRPGDETAKKKTLGSLEGKVPAAPQAKELVVKHGSSIGKTSKPLPKGK